MATLEVSLNQVPDPDFTKDLELWMTNLPPKLRNIPIIDLAIPGSHDSMTYGITRKSNLAPDAEPILVKLRFLGPILKAIMARWTKTQMLTVTKQLECGIRYFDLRIGNCKKNDQYYFVHGLYAEEVDKIFEEIKTFLEAHPKEVVILDCQHFYGFQQSDHERFIYSLTSTFGHKLLPFTPHMEHITLHYMTTESRYQVLTIYRSDAARFGQPLLWPSGCFPTPWADTVDVSKLITFLVEKLRNRQVTIGFISQCVLTPSAMFIAKNVFSTLKKRCLLPLEKEKYEWLKKQKPGRGGINIVISDFVDHKDAAFAGVVVELNRKLLEGSSGDEPVAAMTPVDRGE